MTTTNIILLVIFSPLIVTFIFIILWMVYCLFAFFILLPWFVVIDGIFKTELVNKFFSSKDDLGKMSF